MLDRRSLFFAAAAAAGSATLAAADRPAAKKPLPRQIPPTVRNTRGKIIYIGDEEQERGREWFSYTYREDGQVTLRAYCEMDDIRVQRDIVQTMTSRFAPLDCFCRLSVMGKFAGTGWIRVTDTEAECEVFSTTLGRVHQTVALAMPAPTMVSHPLISDALLMSTFDHGKPDKVQYSEGGLSTSPLLDGASGPMLSVGGRRGTEYLGQEKITTAAGTFDTHHYRMLMNGRRADGTATGYEIWCTHPDYIFIKGEVRGYLTNKTGYGRYELTEFETL
ncbi:MAG: hypothetical protein ABIT36_02520 [Steroidobacteraceae bacterium]